MEIRIGDVVRVLSEKIEGEVTSIVGATIVNVYSEAHGFDFPVSTRDLVVIRPAAAPDPLPPVEPRKLFQPPRPPRKDAPSPGARDIFETHVVEIDLHAGQLLDTFAGMDSGDILEHQLDIFHRAMEEYALRAGQRIVFIHGKGEGVLRQKLLWELRHKYKKHHHQPAPFRQYGYGATLVTIK